MSVDLLGVLDASCVLSDGTKKNKAAETSLRDVAVSPIAEESVSVHISRPTLLSRSIAQLPGFYYQISLYCKLTIHLQRPQGFSVLHWKVYILEQLQIFSLCSLYPQNVFFYIIWTPLENTFCEYIKRTDAD